MKPMRFGLNITSARRCLVSSDYFLYISVLNVWLFCVAKRILVSSLQIHRRRYNTVIHFIDLLKPILLNLVAIITDTYPKVYWKKGDTVVTAKDNTRYRISEKSGGGYSFVVKRARLTDCGKYVCVAENDRGIAICAAFLH